MSRGKRITKEERDYMVELRNSGMSAEQIAEEMGRCPATIHHNLKKADFTPKTEKNEPIPVLENPQGNIIDNFTPLYKRIKYLNEQKKKIDDELRNIRATLQNAVDIIDSGDTAQPIKPSWGVLNNDCCNYDRRGTSNPRG